MEGEKKPSFSIADESYPFGKDPPPLSSANPSSASASSSPSAGYFSSVFPPASAVMGKDSPQGDLYSTLNRPRTVEQTGNAQGASPGGKTHGSPTKKQTTRSKDGNQSEESTYFGSSVHYGGRDFYDSSESIQVPGGPKSYKDDKGEDSSDPNVANRGEWWQGSLYY